MMLPIWNYALGAAFLLGVVALIIFVLLTARVRSHHKELGELLADNEEDSRQLVSFKQASPQPNRLKVLSHNVWGHYFVGGAGVTKRLDALCDHIEAGGYDIVMVQELFLLHVGVGHEMGLFIRFARRMRDMGLCFMFDPREAGPKFLQNHGLAFFSRYPISHTTIRAFPSSAEPVNAKGVACVTVEVPLLSGETEQFFFANFHPDSRNVKSRTRQIEYVSRAMIEHLRGHNITPGSAQACNIIIAGDANVCSLGNPDQYNHMTEKMSKAGAPIDLFPGKWAGREDSPTFINPPLWLDHMYVSRDLASRPRFVSREIKRFKTSDNEYVSDHLGLEAVFALDSSPSAL